MCHQPRFPSYSCSSGVHWTLARRMPALIYSPRLPKPQVNWQRLNTNRDMPTPMKYPIFGCSPDPDFYTTTVQTTEYYGSGGLQSRIIENGLAWERGHPFGDVYGFYTDMGVVSCPDIPVHGYMCCPETGAWFIGAGGGSATPTCWLFYIVCCL